MKKLLIPILCFFNFLNPVHAQQEVDLVSPIKKIKEIKGVVDEDGNMYVFLENKEQYYLLKFDSTGDKVADSFSRKNSIIFRVFETAEIGDMIYLYCINSASSGTQESLYLKVISLDKTKGKLAKIENIFEFRGFRRPDHIKLNDRIYFFQKLKKEFEFYKVEGNTIKKIHEAPAYKSAKGYKLEDKVLYMFKNNSESSIDFLLMQNDSFTKKESLVLDSKAYKSFLKDTDWGIQIDFDEYVNLAQAKEKVYISDPIVHFVNDNKLTSAYRFNLETGKYTFHEYENDPYQFRKTNSIVIDDRLFQLYADTYNKTGRLNIFELEDESLIESFEFKKGEKITFRNSEFNLDEKVKRKDTVEWFIDKLYSRMLGLGVNKDASNNYLLRIGAVSLLYSNQYHPNMFMHPHMNPYFNQPTLPSNIPTRPGGPSFDDYYYRSFLSEVEVTPVIYFDMVLSPDLKVLKGEFEPEYFDYSEIIREELKNKEVYSLMELDEGYRYVYYDKKENTLHLRDIKK